jgi:pectinesterase
MASKLFFFLTFSYFILLPLFATLSFADSNSNSTTPVSQGAICKSTPDPSFCKTVLPNHSANVYDYGRYSVRKSLSQSRKFLTMVDNYLDHNSTLTKSAIQALEDCRLLAGLNMDFLLSSFQTVNKTSKTLSGAKAEEIQSLLSAILTNQQTCLDGIQDTASNWSIKKGLAVPLSNDTKLYSVSLALFTKGWVPKQKKNTTWQPTGKQLGFRHGRLPLKMSSRTRAIYESVSRRKLLQSKNFDEVLVSDIVTVSQDGSGNFTTINDAITAAPNNSAITDGYFLVYVTAGVYEEYVSIAKNKRYLMMIGDGINQTIITGNRSFVDNSTTFNSATFGKNCFPSSNTHFKF